MDQLTTKEVLPEWSLSNPYCHKSQYQIWRDNGTKDSPDGFKAAKMEEADRIVGADMV